MTEVPKIVICPKCGTRSDEQRDFMFKGVVPMIRDLGDSYQCRNCYNIFPKENMK